MIQLAEQSDARLVAERLTGLGGSDAGAVLGINRWTSPTDVYLEKIGETEPWEETPQARWGKLLEAVLAREWSRETGIALREQPEAVYHPEHPWMLAHPDRLGVSRPVVWEGKTTTIRLADEWGPSGQEFHTAADAADQIPAPHVCQVCHYMAVCDCPLAAVSVLIGGQDDRHYWIHRDQAFEALLIERLRGFWFDHVQAKTPPPPTKAEDVAALHPGDDDSGLLADADCIDAVMELHEVAEGMRALEARKKDAQFAVKRFMGDATRLETVAGTKLASWRREGNRASRTFRLSKLKERANVL